MILFETAAGQGTSLGGSIGELSQLVDLIDGAGLCLDTCHLHSSGHDIASKGGMERLLDLIDDTIGMERIRGVHLNDTKTKRGSHVDRHACLGSGEMGDLPFRVLVNDERMRDVPMVLETPGGEKNYRGELTYLRSLRV